MRPREPRRDPPIAPGAAWPHRVGAVVLLVAGAALVTISLQRPAAGRSAPTRPALATPLWSVRRVPQAIVDGVGGQRLAARLAAAAPGDAACAVVADPAIGTVAAVAPTAPLVPASTQKLLVAAAALATLGPDFRYETRLLGSRAPVGGSVDRLFLSGGGDPLLASPELTTARDGDPHTRGLVTTPLAALADALVARGVRTVPGGVTGDDTRYDSTRYLPLWPARFRTSGDIGPLGALTVDGGFTSEGRGAPAGDPALLAAQQLTRLLAARGVVVGPAAHAPAPPDAVTLAEVASAPLRDVLTEMLSASDNLTAELLVREIAVHAGRPGTTADGIAVVTRTLTALGLPTQGLVLADGSGLARDDRASCALLVATLGLTRDPRFASLHDGLAIAATRGTLVDRFQGTALAGHLLAKTGSLPGVTALAGFVERDRHPRFAFVANGSFAETDGVPLREAAVTAVAAYPDAPGPDVLVPGPRSPLHPRRAGRGGTQPSG